jgi:hypothetical protein
MSKYLLFELAKETFKACGTCLIILSIYQIFYIALISIHGIYFLILVFKIHF